MKIKTSNYEQQLTAIKKKIMNLNNKFHEADKLENKNLIKTITEESWVEKKRVVVETKDLWKKYGLKKKYALKNVNLKIYEGDIHGLIGRNGAGKTTLIRTLVGALNITRGEAFIFSENIKNVEVKKHFGYVPEVLAFNKNKAETVWRYLSNLAQLNGIKKEKIRQRVNEVLDMMQIQELKNLCPFDFSSGQKKKVLIAQALLTKPRLLILDEPTANLDPSARENILKQLQNLQKKEGITIMISSHVLLELQQYVTGWTIIDEGKIIENNSYGKLKNKDIIYKLATEDNKRAMDFLRTFEITEDKNMKQLFITLDSSTKEDELQEQVFRLPLRIFCFKKEKLNLEKLFGSLIDYHE